MFCTLRLTMASPPFSFGLQTISQDASDFLVEPWLLPLQRQFFLAVSMALTTVTGNCKEHI